MNALCRFELLLPLRFNDGTSVPRELLAQTIAELENRFGAVTWETQTLQGSWKHEGQTYQDELARLFVDTVDIPAHRDFFIQFKDKMKERFRQLDIWLTVHPIEVL